MSFLLNPFVFAGAAGDFESIATVTVGSGGASSIEFTSIPGTYQHLQIRIVGRSSNSSAEEQCTLQFNGDTSSASYAFHHIAGLGASLNVDGYGTGTLGAITPVTRISGNNAGANIFGVGVIDVVDYSSTSKNKTVRTLNGVDANGSGRIYISSGLWLSTSAITSLKIAVQAGGNLVQHSTAALYGIKAA
jgi:hypothetical protein